MERVFSEDDLPAHFLWNSPPPPLHQLPDDPKLPRSASVWAFQRFLQESASSAATAAAVPISDDEPSPPSKSVGGELRSAGIGSVPVDPVEYQAYLKSRLDLACAAVASSKAPFYLRQSSAAVGEGTSQPVTDQAPGKGSQFGDAGETIGIPSLPSRPREIIAEMKTNTSESQEQSDDNEADSDNEVLDDDEKRAKRMLSNRESARRSRRRKQAYVSRIETQLTQVKDENSTLSKRLTDMRRKYNEVSVDNRILKADVERLKEQVKTADDIIRRVTTKNPQVQTMAEINNMGPEAYSGTPSNSVSAAVPDYYLRLQQQHQYQPHLHANPIPRVETPVASVIATPEHMIPTPGVSVAWANRMGTPPSMQHMENMEHLQKRIRWGVNQSSSSQYNSDR